MRSPAPSAACTLEPAQVIRGAPREIKPLRYESGIRCGAGRTIEQLLEAHPRLTREGVLAAVRFGAEVLRADVAYLVSKSVA